LPSKVIHYFVYFSTSKNSQKVKMLEILEGSIVVGQSGKPLKVVAVDGEDLVLESDTGELIKADRIAVLSVLSPPPPDKIQVGDYLKRRFKEPIQYPAALLGNDSQRNTYGVYPIRQAVVEGLSNDGYWVRSIDDDEIFHVPITAIEVLPKCMKIDQRPQF
jgi:hypothetical protein